MSEILVFPGTQAMPRPMQDKLTIVAYDPIRGEWLVQSFQPSAPGMSVWTVVSAHVERGQAEQMAGLHDSPVRQWLVLHPVLGWRRGSSARVGRVDMAIPCAEAEARLLQERDPKLQLFVVRLSGRVTCPDLDP